MNNFNITPNPSKTMESLRHLTYSNESALADIVDNSLDAGADIVMVDISNDCVTIFDNGVGMSKDTLCEAIKLGSATDKSDNELGRFGMGLVTAGISMARKITVASKMEDEEANCVCLDLDKIKDTGEWSAEFMPFMNMPEIKDQQCYTVVELSNIDGYKYKNHTTLVEKVIAHFGEVFRKFIDAGKLIYVNGKLVDSIDPLSLKLKSTNVIFDEDVKYKEGSFHITLVEVDSDASNINIDIPASMKRQGFYIVRNNRQIASAIMLGGIAKHPSLNRFRCEVSYSRLLDDYIGVNFTKDKIEISQSLEDVIIEKTKMGIRMIGDKSNKRTINDAANSVMDHSDAENIINRKKSLLPNPKGWKEKHDRVKDGSIKPNHADKDKIPREKHNRLNSKKTQIGYRGLNAKFEQASNGSSSPFFDFYVDGSDIVIGWNVDHPFYLKFVAPFNDNKDISSPIDLLAFSIALAEYQVSDNNEQTEKMLQLREEYSKVLRTLMV